MRIHVHGCGPRGRHEWKEAVFGTGRGFGRDGFGGGWGGGEWGHGGRGFGGGFGGGGGRGGRRGMFRPGELRLVLLKLIADQPRHGYDLIQSIEEMTHGAYAPSPGVVYPTLTMLEDMGLIESRASEGSRKVFAVTADGQAHLAERQEEVAGLIERLAGVGEKQRRAGGGSVGRAMGNLAVVLAQRLAGGEVDDDIKHQVSDIIDEAARKIERL